MWHDTVLCGQAPFTFVGPTRRSLLKHRFLSQQSVAVHICRVVVPHGHAAAGATPHQRALQGQFVFLFVCLKYHFSLSRLPPPPFMFFLARHLGEPIKCHELPLGVEAHL